MHLSKNRIFNIAAMGMALGLAVSNGGAQEATFTLRYQAHIGNVTLQPGDYQMKVPSATSVQVIYLYGNGKVHAVLPSAVDVQDVSNRSYLELVNAGGTHFVEKYTSGLTGKTYTFGIPKAAQHQVLANTRATTVAVTGGAGN